MESIIISLPKKLKAFVEDQVAAGGHRDVNAYIQALLRDAEKREAREKVEALILEGINSGPAKEMTAQEWENLRREAEEALGPPRKHHARTH